MNLAEFMESHREQHLAELLEFLRIPSVSAKSEHKPDVERAARPEMSLSDAGVPGVASF
jgi:acetylornithine deacetylase/succinyl-diaminopimelate desuccinylase-like protein